jgi:hypothetical protein
MKRSHSPPHASIGGEASLDFAAAAHLFFDQRPLIKDD